MASAFLGKYASVTAVYSSNPAEEIEFPKFVYMNLI